MDGIHPKFVLSKRFPVHAAIEQLNLHALKELLTPVSDARFHFGRKLTATDLSVLHQACANRPQGLQAVVDIVKLLTALGAPVNDVDVVDQTPLFYAVSHCQASQLVPILLRAGANVNKQRKGDGWTPLFVAAMLGRLDIATLLLQAGADTRVEDEEDRTAEMVAHQYGHHMVADIINSPREKYRPEFPTQFMEFLKTSSQPDSCTILWDEHIDWRDESGCTLLHIACWTGNIELFKLFCSDTNGRKLLALSTTCGLSPLMLAIINGQSSIIEEYLTNRNSKNTIHFNSDTIKETKQTIPHLLFQYCPTVHPKFILKRKDLTPDIMNAVDYHGNTSLLKCCIQNSRDTVRRLLSSKAATERHLLDLSVQNMYGKTALHYLVINNDKHNVRLFLNLLEDAGDALNAVDVNEMSPLAYCLAKGHHDIANIFLTHPNSKDKLSFENGDEKARILAHLAAEKDNFTEPPPEAPKQEPKKSNGISKFQQQMNDIYNSSEKEKKPNAPNPANALKIQNAKTSSTPEKKIAPKPSPKIVESKMENGKISNKEMNGNHVNGSIKEDEKTDDGPSIEEIRAMWKKKRPEPETKKTEEFNVNNVFEDLMKKAEEKVKDSKAKKSDEDHLAESMNEEIMWAIQQKKQHEEENRSLEEKLRLKEEKDEKERKAKLEKEKERLKEEAQSKVKSEQVKEQEMLQNLAEAMEKKSEQRRLSRLAKSNQMSEEERKKKEEQDIQDAMNEEITWAMEQKAQMAEEQRKKDEEEYRKKQEEEKERLLMQGIADRQKAKEKAEEDRLNNIKKEQERLLTVQKEAEEKLRKAKEEQAKREEKLKEEDENFAKLPKWKRDKIQRDKLKKEKEEDFEKIEKEKREAEEKRKEEEEYKARLEEEMDWARQVKKQEEDQKHEKNDDKHNSKKEEKSSKEKERERAAKEEQKLIEELEKQALEKIEKAKKEKEVELANWQKQKLIRESEVKRKEQEEMDNRLAEEIRWAEEIKAQAEKEKEERERKEKEQIEEEKRRVEYEKKEEERRKKAKAEKDMLEMLEKEAKEKLRIQKEEEEKRLKDEQEAWEKMPRWKKEKILRERKGSLTNGSPGKSSLLDSSEQNSPAGTPVRKDSLNGSQCDNGLNQTESNINVIINGENSDNVSDLKEESMVNPVGKLKTPNDMITTKWSEWVEKELEKTKEIEVKDELKPPAPVRRKRIPTGEETEETVVPAIRPTRKSKPGDFNHEKSPSLSSESPISHNAPVASMRSRRSKADMPSPAATETGEGVTDADLENEIVRAKENIEDTEVESEEINSKGDWYWDDEIGWVQDQPSTEETITDCNWYWDDNEGWVQDIANETQTLLQNELMSTKQEEEKRRQQIVSSEKEKIEVMEKDILVKKQKRKEEEERLRFLEQEIIKKIKIEKENIYAEKLQSNNVAKEQEDLSVIPDLCSTKDAIKNRNDEERESMMHNTVESNGVRALLINQDENENMKKEEMERQRILRIEKEEKEKEREQIAKKEHESIQELEKKALEKIEQAKKQKDAELSNIEKQKLMLENEARIKEQEEMNARLAEEMRWAEEIQIQAQKDKEEKETKEKENIEEENKRIEHEKKENERQKRVKAEKDMIKRLEEEAKEKLRIQKLEEEKRLKEKQEVLEEMPQRKKEKIHIEQKEKSIDNAPRKGCLVDNTEKCSLIGMKFNKDEIEKGKINEHENNELQMRLDEEIEWANEVKRQQEQQQSLCGNHLREKAESQKNIYREQKRKEEEANIASLELHILNRISCQKEKEVDPGSNATDNSDVEWNWDDTHGWVQVDVLAETTESEQSEADWYWDDEKGWVQDDAGKSEESGKSNDQKKKEEELTPKLEYKQQESIQKEKENIEKLEKELMKKIEIERQEEDRKTSEKSKKKQEEDERLKMAEEHKRMEQENYELQMRLEEEIKLANEMKIQQEEEQALKDKRAKEEEEKRNLVEREKKRKEEKEKIKNLESDILNKIEKIKIGDNWQNIIKDDGARCEMNIEKDEDKNKNTGTDSEDCWYWDDEKGWVQYNEQQGESPTKANLQNEECNKTCLNSDNDGGSLEDVMEQTRKPVKDVKDIKLKGETENKSRYEKENNKRIEDFRRDRQFELMQEIEAMEDNDMGKIKAAQAQNKIVDNCINAENLEKEKEEERNRAYKMEREKIENIEKELLARILIAKQEEADKIAAQKKLEQEESLKRVEEELRREEELRLQEEKEKQEKEIKENERLESIKRKEEAENKEQERKRRIKAEKEMIDNLEKEIMQKLLLGKK